MRLRTSVSHSSSIYDVQNITYNCSSGSPELGLRLQAVSSEQTQGEDEETEQSFITTYHNGRLTEGGWLTSMLMSLVLKANCVSVDP